MTHTKGPWKVVGLMPVGISDTEGNIIARPQAHSALPVDTYYANARLIAAAPELLEMLRSFVEQNRFEELRDGSYIDMDEADVLLARF